MIVSAAASKVSAEMLELASSPLNRKDPLVSYMKGSLRLVVVSWRVRWCMISLASGKGALKGLSEALYRVLSGYHAVREGSGGLSEGGTVGWGHGLGLVVAG